MALAYHLLIGGSTYHAQVSVAVALMLFQKPPYSHPNTRSRRSLGKLPIFCFVIDSL
jgi:hypothetical protein